MSKEIIHTDKAPQAIGTYSQAVKHQGLVFISGQIPLDPESMEVVTAASKRRSRRYSKTFQPSAQLPAVHSMTSSN